MTHVWLGLLVFETNKQAIVISYYWDSNPAGLDVKVR
jgi:hypothetical protein